MKKKISFLAVILAILMAFTLVGCNRNRGNTSSGNKQQKVDLAGVVSDGATVKMSVLYEGLDTRMKYLNSDGTVPYYQSDVDNNYYATNSFKPAWKQLQTNLNFKITDVTPEKATSVSSAFDTFQANEFRNVDIMSGPVTNIVDKGTNNNTFVDLSLYLDEMPNFKAYINEYGIVKKTITSSGGEIFYAPYFDGFNDIETMLIARIDWVEKLLDEANPTFDTDTEIATYYNSFYDQMDTTFEVANADASAKQTIKVQYGADQGIIDIQNRVEHKNGKELTTKLREYIDAVYMSGENAGKFSKRSEVFVGQNACYNADELIALLRCVKTNPTYLSGKATVYPFYPRSKDGNRTAAVIQLSQIWGVRGYDSRNSYFYIDKDGNLADGRTSADMMEALTFLNQIYKEGLILADYDMGLGDYSDYRDTFNQQNQGFLTYDYNQTTTIYNDISGKLNKGMNLSPILFPVADWDNKATASNNGYQVTGANTLYQYTESWRSIKTEGWAILNSTTSNKAVFKKCLEIFDYMYSAEGQRLMTYGPDAWIKHDAEGNIVTMEYRGRQIPVISDKALAELKDKNKGGGNYTNYYRRYVGATLPIGYEKEQGMEFQTVDTLGLVGLDYINKAVDLGTLKHADINLNSENIMNSLVPTTFALTDAQNRYLLQYCSDLGKKFNNSSADGYNEFHRYIKYGFNNTFGDITTLKKADFIAQIQETWGGTAFLETYATAYNRMYGR